MGSCHWFSFFRRFDRSETANFSEQCYNSAHGATKLEVPAVVFHFLRSIFISADHALCIIYVGSALHPVVFPLSHCSTFVSLSTVILPTTRRLAVLWLSLGIVVFSRVQSVAAEENASTGAPETAKAFFIGEYQVKGSRLLKPVEIETAVYPFLGPGRTEADVQAACAALEKMYREKGYGAALVQYDSRVGKGGVVTLQVAEGTVARVRVKGSRYFSTAKIKADAPSLAEGKPINLNEVNKDMVALNQTADLRVSPALKPGAEPGTYEVELEVKDKLPVHASVDLNNRNGPDTTPLRLNASVRGTNLWQLGHVASLSYQMSPEKPEEVSVLSGYYLWRQPGLKDWSVMVQGTKQDSNVSTIGDVAVVGKGETVGFRLSGVLTGTTDFYHSVSLGMDYKHYRERLITATGGYSEPITTYPFNVYYNATWLNTKTVTDASVGVNFHLRGMGSSPEEFNARRKNADGGYIYAHATLSQERELPWGLQAFARVQGQLSNMSLLSSEKISGGGVGTVRGYFEAEATGDNGAFATIELRSPSLLRVWEKKAEPGKSDAKVEPEKKLGEWRCYAFADWGGLVVIDPLPEEQSRFELASVGLGTRIKLYDHFSGSLDAGYPLKSISRTKAHELRVLFQLGVDY